MFCIRKEVISLDQLHCTRMNFLLFNVGKFTLFLVVESIKFFHWLNELIGINESS